MTQFIDTVPKQNILKCGIFLWYFLTPIS